MLLSWAYPFCLFGYLCFVFFLASIVLMQEGKGGSGLGGLSSGAGGAQAFLGTATVNVLRKTTAWGVFFFLLSCIFLSAWTTRLEPPPSPVSVEEALIGEDIPEDLNLQE